MAESQKGAIWAGFFKILDAAILVIPGIIAFQLLAGRMDTSVGMAADAAYPMLILEIVPKPLLGFLAAVMFGAILSSFNSVLNSSVTIFMLDLYQPIFAPQAKAAKLVKMVKVFGMVIAVAATIVAPFVMFFGTGIMNFINECWGFFAMPLYLLFSLLGVAA